MGPAALRTLSRSRTGLAHRTDSTLCTAVFICICVFGVTAIIDEFVRIMVGVLLRIRLRHYLIRTDVEQMSMSNRCAAWCAPMAHAVRVTCGLWCKVAVAEWRGP